MKIRILLGVVAALWVMAGSARADTAQILQAAAADYRQGHVLDAEKTLQTALQSVSDAKERWAMANLLTDICTYSYDYACIASSQKSLGEAAKALDMPRLTATKVVFAIAFQQYLGGNLDFFRQNGGLDFSLKIADPLADPALATRLFLLNAAILQQAGDFGAAHRFIDRAFASFLRIDAGKDAFESSSLLKELISVTLANHDAARALHWALIGDPIIQAGLVSTSFDHADYLALTAAIAQTVSTGDPALETLNRAMDAFSRLQIAPALKDNYLSTLAINQAAIFGLRGDNKAMLERLAADPYFARRDRIIAKGAFSSFNEMYYASAEIFFDALSGKTPDQNWKPLFEKIPNWTLSADLASEGRIYAKVALALLGVKSDADGARRMFEDAARESLATFERGRGDAGAFPLPSLLDRILLTITAGMMPPEPKGADADLLLGSLELLDRNPRYVISDTLAMLAAQRNDEQRHAAHAMLRLADRRQEWEARQLRDMAQRLAAHRDFPAGDFTPQFAAQNFADSLARLGRGVTPAPTRLPGLAELQAALAPDEAFLGYVQGLRICVRRGGMWNSRMRFDAAQLPLDVKLLAAALSAQNAPSDTLDAQYPAAAAMRLYHLLLDDLGPCLSGAHHLIYFPPGDVQAIPLAALLREEPPRAANGYDLSKAHWLILDYAVSTVTSVRDFLSARALSAALSRRPGASLDLAAIADPKLRGPAAAALKDLPELPETRQEVSAIAGLFKSGTDLKLGDAATEENFRSLPLDQYRVLHFATHGLLRDDIDGLSQAALVFTPQDAKDKWDDGLLTAGDVANLNLAAQLVVLSACNTANFDPAIFISPLEGLASAFASAGAPTTVASLWSVNSQTGLRLMVRFYQKLLGAGAPSVAAALQQAMIDTIREAPSSAFANPRFWAPFIVMGDGGTVLAARKPDQGPSGRDSRVEISAAGGEITAMVPAGGGLVSAEIASRADGRAGSFIRRRNGGAIAWTLEDPDASAGMLVAGKDASFAAGTAWRGKAVPLLRAVSNDGKLLWRTELNSRFDNSAIAALSLGPDGLFAVIAPLNEAPDRIAFEILHLDMSGREISRRAVTTARPMPGPGAGRTMFVSALMDGSLYIAAAYAPGSLKPARNDFGFISVCYQGGGTHLYKIKAANLETEGDADQAGLRVASLQAGPGGLVFAGAQPEGCAATSEKSIFGRLGPDLAPRILWKDDGVFYGHLVSVVRTPDGYAGIADLTEPLDMAGPTLADLSRTDGGRKPPDFLDAALSETVFIRFDEKGAVKEKKFLGNGLPEFSRGLAQVGAGVFAVYGSDGPNPWIARVN